MEGSGVACYQLPFFHLPGEFEESHEKFYNDSQFLSR
jgi:hypothetical protein